MKCINFGDLIYCYTTDGKKLLGFQKTKDFIKDYEKYDNGKIARKFLKEHREWVQ